MEEPIIFREEAAALLFKMSDIAETLVRIEKLLRGDDEEADES